MKNVLLQMKIEGIVHDLMVRTNSANVIVDATTNETLETRLASIMTSLGTILTEAEAQTMINAAIDELIGGAPETYDTLKEIADYIETHEDTVTAINAAIGNKVDKVEGKGLSTNDFTDALKTKLEGLSTGANKVEASTTNGNIKIDGTETPVYVHPTAAGNKHVPTGGADGQHLVYGGASGTAAWADPEEYIRSGATTPEDLTESQLFIKLLA